MILVDTSVWVDHLRHGDASLSQHLSQAQVMCHPMVVGELACGNLKSRSVVLALLADLPGASVASEAEVLGFIQAQSLFGLGIGYVHLPNSMVSNSGRATSACRRWPSGLAWLTKKNGIDRLLRLRSQ